MPASHKPAPLHSWLHRISDVVGRCRQLWPGQAAGGVVANLVQLASAALLLYPIGECIVHLCVLCLRCAFCASVWPACGEQYRDCRTQTGDIEKTDGHISEGKHCLRNAHCIRVRCYALLSCTTNLLRFGRFYSLASCPLQRQSNPGFSRFSSAPSTSFSSALCLSFPFTSGRLLNFSIAHTL